MMSSMTRRAVALLIGLLVIAGAAFITLPYYHGLSLVARAAEIQGTIRRIADFDVEPFTERDVEVPLRGGSIRARVYEPSSGFERTALLVSGLHPSGITEPRLVGLAQDLAASGVAVLTPDIPDLSQFSITPAITDAIEQAAEWLAAQPAFAPDGKVGLMGISFSGGLSVVAAGRPSIRDRVAYVFSFGGHADLPRTLKYLCTGVEPPPPDSQSTLRQLGLSGAGSAEERPDPLTSPPPPHDYGVAVILLGLADRVAPAAQVAPLRDAVRRFLFASAWDREDKARADAEFAALRELAKRLPEPSATLLRYVNDRDVAHLGARLAPYVGFYGDHPALSAARAPHQPAAPVFLLHGLADNVIPAAESVHLAAHLRGGPTVRLLLSGLISHAEADRPVTFRDVMNLGSFWGDILGR
jgi:dienelactone hydrolase